MQDNSAAAQMLAGNPMLTMVSGKWAGERLAACMMNGEVPNAQMLRTNATLRKDEWIYFDQEVIAGAVPRLRGIADLIAAGLTKPLPNSMGVTVIRYDISGDIADATVSMDGMVISENDRPDGDFGQLPVPITHKDFFIPLRVLAASRRGNEPLDTTMIRLSGEKVAEMQERMLFSGGKQFGGLPIYGYTTHPDRHTESFGTNGNWAQAAKTGENIYDDVQTLIQLLRGDGFYGPYWLYHGTGAAKNLDKDYKAAGSITTRQRLLQIEQLTAIREADFVGANEVLVVAANRETALLYQGEPLQTIQWDVNGGFGINFKAFQIQVPLIRARSGRSGIAHMA